MSSKGFLKSPQKNKNKKSRPFFTGKLFLKSFICLSACFFYKISPLFVCLPAYSIGIWLVQNELKILACARFIPPLLPFRFCAITLFAEKAVGFSLFLLYLSSVFIP
jgi:hypothetical protein